jgi:hypothetical protein
MPAVKAPGPPRIAGAAFSLPGGARRRGWRRLACAAALLLVWGGPASALEPPLSWVAGDWGIERFRDMRCETNPHRLILSADGREVVFAWAHPVDTAIGPAPPEITYRIDAVKGARLLLTRTDTGEGAVMEFLEGGAAYRWKGGGDADFHDGYRRCALAGG